MKKKYHSKYLEVLNDTSQYIQKALKGDVVPQLDEDKPSWLTSMASVICEAQADVITATKFNWKIKKTDYKRLALSVLDVPYWIEVIICLNNDLWENLQDFRWEEATQNWSNDVAKVIIDCLECTGLKTPVLQCMIEAWRVADNGANIDIKWGELRFDSFCKNLICHIKNHDLYSIEAIKARQNDRSKNDDDEISSLELPKELQSDEAQVLLQKANGVIGQENTSPTSKQLVSKRGRPNKKFQDIILDEKETSVIMDGLACLLRGKTGKNAVLIMACAINMGLIGKPTYNAFCEAFKPDGVSKPIYNKYLNLNLYSSDEIHGMKEAIRQKIDSLKQ